MLKSSGDRAIRLRGVRHNNLKNFDLDLPLHRLIVITGLSGSGKSSLAFDTLFAEGQRRYIETFSPYARQFFDRMDKPQADGIEGIPPAIAIEQRNAVRTTRSTVGTMTEICDHMKVLWPHLARLHCRQCGRLVQKDSPQRIWQVVQQWEPRGRQPGLLITFDVPLSEKLPLDQSLALVGRQGYQRLLVEGEMIRLDAAAARLGRAGARVASLTVIQERLAFAGMKRARFVEACEQAYHFGKGRLAVRETDNAPGGTEAETRNGPEGQRGSGAALLATHHYSNRFHCAACDIEYREPTPALFSFNHPAGACPTCRGFGRTISIDYDLAIPDQSLTLAKGVVKPWRTGFSAECQEDLAKFCKIRGVPMDVPFEKLSERHRRWVLEGDADYGKDKDHEWPRAWYGVKGYFRWLESKAYKMHIRVLLSRYRAYRTCPDCRGARFQPESLLYTVALDPLRTVAPRGGPSGGAAGAASFTIKRGSKLTLADFYALAVRDALVLIDALIASRAAHQAARNTNDPVDLVLSEVRSRLNYLDRVGLGYLTLDRPTRSLSGGETERVNLTTCLGTRLVNTLFVLDEPSVGLHPRDTERLVRVLEQLRDAGNTVVVVEHEASVIRAADRVVDLGPGHGATGGWIVYQGPFAGILQSKESLTGQYLSGRRRIEIPGRRLVSGEGGSCRDLRPRHGGLPAGGMVLKDTAVPWKGGGNGGAALMIEHARRHNLQDITVKIPLGRFVCITGVSGSGKTTLIREALLPALEKNFKLQIANCKFKSVESDETIDDEGGTAGGDTAEGPVLSGWEQLERVVLVDQSILGKTPRSNPAVYVGAFDDIREFYAQSEPARQRGLNASAFSFNSSQGQCERCHGAGFEKIEMQFLSDVFIRCPDCNGRRYRKHILEVRVAEQGARGKEQGARGKEQGARSKEQGAGSREQRGGKGARRLGSPGGWDVAADARRRGWSIADLLEATADEAVEFLGTFPESRPANRAVESLKLLQEVGLGYLRLGQPINTLSGGESQRLKLVRHLAESRAAAGPAGGAARETGGAAKTADFHSVLFLFDEPTTGLHFDDVRVLLKVFQRLVDSGHSVVVIEHNLDVIKSADWIIDLGPEAGAGGGRVVAEGTPEEVAACESSHTGHFLRGVLGARSAKPRTRRKARSGTVPPGPASAAARTLDP